MLGAMLGAVRIDTHPAHGILGEYRGRVRLRRVLVTATATARRVVVRVGVRAAGSVVLIGHGGILDGGTLI